MNSTDYDHRYKSNVVLKLDIACGKNKKPGFSGVDIWDGADIVVDLEKFPWPFEDNSVDEVFCSHYIEHTSDLISFVNELYRIMKVGAKAEIIAPYYSSIRAWQDPTHLRAISENTFLYFNKDWRVLNRLDHYPIVSDFDYEASYIIDPAWRDKTDVELEFAIKHYINVVSDINTILTKKKYFDLDTERKITQAYELWAIGNSEEAVEICNQILACGTYNSEIYLMLAEHAYQSGDLYKAKNFFAHALHIDGESLQAHIGLIRVLKKAGLHADAQSHYADIKAKNSELAELIAPFIDSAIE